MIKGLLIGIFLRLIRDYTIFYVNGDEAYLINDITLDEEMKDIIVRYVERGDNDD